MSTGEDLYPLLHKKEPEYDPPFQPLSRKMFHEFGLFPRPSDDHIGEYLAYGWEYCGLEGYNFDGADQARAEKWNQILAVAAGEQEPELPPPDQEARYGIGEPSRPALPIISGIVTGKSTFIDSINIPNSGLIDNLPDWAVVEVPGVAGFGGLRGIKVGPLPAGIAALCRTQIGVQDLCIDAAVKGSRELALQAMLADPVVQSAQAAEECLDELLRVYAPYLPQFEK